MSKPKQNIISKIKKKLEGDTEIVRCCKCRFAEYNETTGFYHCLINDTYEFSFYYCYYGRKRVGESNVKTKTKHNIQH